MFSAASLSLSESDFSVFFHFSQADAFSFFSSIYPIFISPPPRLNMPSFFSFQLEYLYFLISFFSLLVVLFPFTLPISSALFAARLAPHYFTFPKLKDSCHPLQGLRLRNFISFTFNYWFGAHGFPQPRPCPSRLRWLMSPIPFSPPWVSLGSPVFCLHDSCPAS